VQLVDVYPTLAELAGIPVPPSAGLDGTSLVQLMTGHATNASNVALSVYPRCPANTTDPANMWKDNDCLYVERTTFPFMGLSLRTGPWRYTEWLPWNASLQVRAFSDLGPDA
jgi:arylsulfatase A-like enzyme